ncbi:MAG: hypothetical protein NDJ90_16150, partial [Oligoflexia bacterium]|nr:hypothetical protein [Oligoflexia bacterium]
MNPQIDAEHAISKALAAREIAVLHAADAEEGWKLLQLHGKSVDLALIHLEGQSNPEEGLALVRRLKADSSQADLPFVISSAVWDDSRFAEHQGTPQGANAYLHWPFSAGQFCELLGSLFPSEGTSEIARPASPSVPPPPPASLTGSLTKTRNEAPRPAFPAAPSALPVDSGTGSFDSAALVLEDASHIFKAPVSPSAKECSDRISLEVPEMPPEPAEAAPAQESAQESAPVAEVMEIAELASPEAIELVPLSPPVLDPPTRVIPDSAVALSLELSNPGFGSAEPSMVSMNPTEPAHEPDVADSNLVLSVDAVLEAAAEEAVMAIPPSAPAEHEPRIDERESQVDERELAAEMPYLFSAAREASEPAPNAALAFSHPVGDAVVPGGAAQSPDVETLKKYLLLREQDVAVLSSQLTAAQAQLQELEGQLR